MWPQRNEKSIDIGKRKTADKHPEHPFRGLRLCLIGATGVSLLQGPDGTGQREKRVGEKPALFVA